MKQYDAIVIGAGQGGNPLAKKLALAGKKTALIEKRWIGGTCVNDGCTPTKAMVASARAAYMAGHSGLLGIKIKGFSVNMPAVKKRSNEIIHQFRDSSQKSLEATKNLDVIFGEAAFTGNKTLSVKLNEGGKTIQLKAGLIFINTGAKTFVPDIEGLADIDYLTSTTILNLNYVPERLLIIGGNYIGLEFGQMFGRFGSKVTIVEHASRIVPREDEDVSETLAKILHGEGITIHTDAITTGFKKNKSGKIIVTAKIGGIAKNIKCSHVLIAVGRVPQTEALNLAKTGVKTNKRGAIQVNSHLQTNVKGIYALGDVKGGPAFTHISYNDYTIIYRNLLKNENLSTTNRLVPYCMFTDPQLGRIGLDETEAKKLKLNYKVAKLPMAYVARAIETGNTRGFMKAIVDAGTKLILGATILGAEGGEIITVLQMAIMGGLTYEQLRYCTFAHPLYAEALNNLFIALDT